MKLKILILPTFIILELILVISYIKPNIDAITTMREEIALEKDALSRVDSVTANIGSINQSLADNTEKVSFVERYYPREIDEERIVDMFNYLAQLSGVIIVEFEVTRNEKQAPAPSETPAVDESGAIIEALPDGPESYEVTVSVLGAYQNIKDFFNRVHRSDRLHVQKGLSVTLREGSGSPEGIEEDLARGIQPDFLRGSVTADFLYLKERRVGNALNVAIFKTPEFDFSSADTLIDFVTSPIPVLEVSGAGSPNPFQ